MLKFDFCHPIHIFPNSVAIPKFPMVQKTKKPKSLDLPTAKTPLYILPHFSPYPDNYSYIQTPVCTVNRKVCRTNVLTYLVVIGKRNTIKGNTKEEIER